MKDVSDIINEIDLDASGRGEPLAQRLAREFARLIETGKLQPGQKLPPTVQLADMLGISRQVAQDGLVLLSQRNLLRRKPGLGTMVLEPKDAPTVGLLAFVGGGPSLTADVGWVIANDFIHLMEERGWDHREYVTPREGRPPGNMPPRLTDDLLGRKLDALFYATIYESFIQENVPSNEVPTFHLSPSQIYATPSITKAVEWLVEQECQRIGGLFEMAPEVDEIAAHFQEKCGKLGVDAPDQWIQKGCLSSIAVGRKYFHEFYQGDDTPDGLLVMDDMIAYGLIEEARKEDYYLDHSSIIVMVNKGSSLYIPPTCPRIELNWKHVMEHAFEEWIEQGTESSPEVEDRRDVYQFEPYGGRRESELMDVPEMTPTDVDPH